MSKKQESTVDKVPAVGTMKTSQLCAIPGLFIICVKVLAKTVSRTNVDRLLINPGLMSLIVPLVKTTRALYTFKAVILEEPCTCEDLGLANDLEICRRESLKLLEQLGRALDEPDVHAFNEKVSKILKHVREDIARSLHHELLHVYILKGTYALTVAEKYSWRVRLDNMYFMENFYKTVGRKLASEVEKYGFKVHPEFRNIKGFEGLEESDARKVLQVISPYLKDLVTNPRVTSILRDGYVHNLHLRYLVHPIVVPVVEVVTWYVMDEDIYSNLEVYKDASIFDEDLHGPVLDKLVDVVDKKKPDKSFLVRAANAALDFTQKEYEKFIISVEDLAKLTIVPNSTLSIQNKQENTKAIKKAVAQKISEFVPERFKAALEGKPVTRTPKKLKTLGRVLLYAIPTDISLDPLQTFISILSDEGLWNVENVTKIIGAMRLHVGEHTAIHIDIDYGDRLEPVGYNPLSPFFGHYIRRTDSVLTTTELLVGDLVLALRGFLTLGHDIGVLQYELGHESYLYEVVNQLNHLPKVRMILLERPDIYEVIVLRSESFLKLHESLHPKYAYDVIESFIYAVLTLGEKIKVLEGPHGLWYL